MSIRVRDLCKQSLAYAIEQKLLPDYSVSGRYVEPACSRRHHALSEDIKRLAHYGSNAGDLYRDERQWRSAYQLVRRFVKGSALPRRWYLPKWLGPLASLPPVAALAQLHTAVLRQGFSAIDRNDASFSAAFTMEDSCKVSDLPEPYGKWLQLRESRPRWQEKQTLTLDLRCHIDTEDADNGVYQTFVSFELTACAAPLLLEIQQELLRLLYLNLTADESANLEARLLDSLRRELRSL